MPESLTDVIWLNDFEKSIDALHNQAGAESGLTDATFDILYALTVYGDGCSQRELCDRCWIGKQTVHSAIERLAKRGLLSIEPGRGRSTCIVLTEEGRILAQDKVFPIAEAESRALKTFTPAEKKLFKSMLERYRTALARELDVIGEVPCK